MTFGLKCVQELTTIKFVNDRMQNRSGQIHF